MKKILFIALCVANYVLGQNEKVTEYDENFNFKAADGYFYLIDRISETKTISNLEWSNFLEIEGNQLYISENNIPSQYLERLKESIIQVYTSKTIEGEEDMVLKIRKNYRAEDSLYREHLKFLKNHKKRIIDSMVTRVKRFLPNNELLNDSLPKIYYHALDHDGSANRKGIFISMMAAHENNSKRLANFESHEFFHIQRPNLLENVKVDSLDNGILWALNATINEGIADMVDKEIMLADESDWWLKDMVVDFYIGNSKDVIHNLDRLIQEEAKGVFHSEEKFRDVLLGSVGHVPGYWMASLITEQGQSQAMIDNANNPFEFFIIYNNIALLNSEKYPTFSSTAIEYIKLLSKKYNVYR